MTQEQIYETLFTLFDSLVRLDAYEKERIRDLSETLSVPAKINLIEEGKRVDRMYFLVKGAVRCFHYYDAVEKNIWFTFEHNFVSSLTGFITQQPSPETIQTMEESDLIFFTKTDFFDLVDNSPKLNMVYRNMLEIMFVEKERALQRHYYTATQKYQNLLEENPQVLQRVPLGYVASYLGINQATLSRIRKNTV